MLMKESLAFVFILILLNCMRNECRLIQCYSCSDCANSTSIQMNTITTTKDEDQCMKTIILINKNPGKEQLVHRGASSNCRPYSNDHLSIICCRSDFCNA